MFKNVCLDFICDNYKRKNGNISKQKYARRKNKIPITKKKLHTLTQAYLWKCELLRSGPFHPPNAS